MNTAQRSTGTHAKPPHCPPELLPGARTFRVRPGFTGLLWRPVARPLTPAARAYLRRELPQVAVETFTGTTAQYWHEWLSDTKLDDLSGLVVVLDTDGRPAAWVASNTRILGGRRCFYANSAGVHPRHQGAGLSSAIWRELLGAAVKNAAPRRLYAVMRTGNPLVYGAWSTAAGGPRHTYPAPGRQAPNLVRRIATDTAVALGQLDRFDADTFVITDAYDDTESGLWTQRPESDHTATDRWLGQLLGARDAVVLVVVFHPLKIAVGEVWRTLRLRFGLGTHGSSRSSRVSTKAKGRTS